MTPLSNPDPITRREAIQRAALLLGFAISPSILTGVMRAQAAPVERSSYLSVKHLAIASAVADLILPRTDTPGAVDVGVLSFIDLMYGEHMNAEEREQFTNGLDGLEAASLGYYRQPYSRLNSGRQEIVLKAVAEAGQEMGNPFFNQVKELTIVGYFTSEKVARNILRYEPNPGPYRGCIPVSEVGKATWTPMR
jgi:gluconate 2-dehydrogenase gamma chain